jgi:NAD-dependent dihydropyrimidine dehydrogenase PreA subunit
MARKKIARNNERCSGCLSCALACSLFNFDVINPERSFIKLDKDEKTQSFVISIEEGCKLCGECVKSCAYEALRWEDENSPD